MKCLEKDRGRRYETANGLARDMGFSPDGNIIGTTKEADEVLDISADTAKATRTEMVIHSGFSNPENAIPPSVFSVSACHPNIPHRSALLSEISEINKQQTKKAKTTWQTTTNSTHRRTARAFT
jgi:hypothetical protein